MENCTIPTEEIKQDIQDTEAEIAELERKIEGCNLLGDRMALFRATGYRNGIDERKKFIDKLNNILKSRE